MSDSRSRRSSDLFQEALELPPERRHQFLREACAGDAGLEADVRSLLEAHAEAEGFLTGGQLFHALADPGLPGSETDPLLDATIGNCRILGLLGRGGMGVVYRAEQENPRREVALKLIDRHFVTSGLLQRFEREAQLLARLKHAGIAQIHLAGSTGPEAGDRPYFAMELVEGPPLTSFADGLDLDLRDRLELVIRICDAVQHAHQVGVIHRDLKPANILVTAEGQPKILDFGIARGTDADLQVTTMGEPGTGLLGTLPYMSPEQARGRLDEIDTRSDVHALGAITFELLTGEMPRDTAKESITEAIRVVADEEPRRLGTVGGKRFPRDLETVVAKALASDREQRYASANELAQDIRRFLDGQPINARGPSTLYQVRKLVARNRLASALVVGLVLLALASTVFVSLQADRIAGERDRANSVAQTASESLGFLRSLFIDATPERRLGREMTARDLLDSGVERMKSDLRDQPIARGSLLAMLGRVYYSLGDVEKAEPLLEEAVNIGRGLRRPGEQMADDADLQTALQTLSSCRTNAGRHDEAIELAREALAYVEEIYGTEDDHYADALDRLAGALGFVPDRRAEARELILEGLAIRERVLPPGDQKLGGSHFAYARNLQAAGEFARAAEQYDLALAIWEKELPEERPEIGMCIDGYSKVLGELDRKDDALAMALRAVALRRRVLGNDHPATVDSLNNVGRWQLEMGRLQEARSTFESVAEAHEIALGPQDPGLLRRLYTVALVCARQRDYPGKEDALRRAVDLAREHHATSPEELSLATGKLSMFLYWTGRHQTAEPLLEETAELLEQMGKQGTQDLAVIFEALANCRHRAGDAEAAIAIARELLPEMERHPDWKTTNPLALRYTMGLDLLYLERIEDAEACFHSLLADLDDPPRNLQSLPWSVRWCLSLCDTARGREGNAMELRAEVLAAELPEAERRWTLLRRAEAAAEEWREDEARQVLQAVRAAGLPPWDVEWAFRVNSRIEPALKASLFEELRSR